jgi:hypothetical protein
LRQVEKFSGYQLFYCREINDFASESLQKAETSSEPHGAAARNAKKKRGTRSTIRLKPFEKEKPIANCICCGEKAVEMAYLARPY